MTACVCLWFAVGPGTEADFSPTRGQTVDLVFGPGVTEVVVPIRIIDDIRLEEDRESFFSALSLTTVEPAVTLNPASATVEIIDNDGTAMHAYK